MLQYIIKLSISITVVYLFYQLLLRRLTFYNLNRWYLLIYSMLCLVIPFINVFTLVAGPQLQQSALIRYIPAIEQMTTTYEAGVPAVVVDEGVNYMQLIIAVIGAGIVFMILRLLVQYYSLFKLRSKAVLLYNDNVKLYHIDKPIVPFSFGRSIYINQGQHSEEELKEIIRHEFIHVKQRHSADIIWSELLCIINWYNPFAWLLRKAIRQNLEFIADEQVLQTGFDRKQYQYLLLKVIGIQSFSIATNFNFSSLKKRIAMMNKTKSARVHLIRFLFMLPLLMVILLAFRNTVQQQRQQQPLRSLVTDTIPAASIAPKLPDEVVTIDINDDEATVRLKNGQIEKYDLSIAKEKKAFESKYGAVPKPPLPPTPPAPKSVTPLVPPVPPAPPAKELKAVIAAGVPAPPPPAKELEAVTVTGVPGQPHARQSKVVFVNGLPPRPVQVDCFTPKGYCVTIADNNGECVVIVKDRQNKIVEAVALNDWNKDPQYKEKYGEIPSVPKPVKHVVSVSIPKKQVTTFAAPQFTIPPSKPVVFVAKSVPVEPSIGITGFKGASAVQTTEEILAGIGKSTTKEELEQIRNNLNKKGLKLDIQNADYKNGYLTGIKFKISDKRGGAGEFSTNDFNQIQVIIARTIDEKGKAGFTFYGRTYEVL